MAAPASDAKGAAMPQQDQPRIRKALLAGTVALALTGTGAALAWSADSPTPSPSQSAPGQDNRGDKPAKPDKAQRPQLQHSESVVKRADGTFQTVLEQRGTVESVSATAITVKSEDGYTRTYAVTADTKIAKVPAPAADGAGSTGSQGATGSPGATADGGKRHKQSPGTIADITAGEVVRISGVKNGDQATADRIAEGAGDLPGLGLGRGHGLGHGKDHGYGNGLGRGHGHGNQPK